MTGRETEGDPNHEDRLERARRVAVAATIRGAARLVALASRIMAKHERCHSEDLFDWLAGVALELERVAAAVAADNEWAIDARWRL